MKTWPQLWERHSWKHGHEFYCQWKRYIVFRLPGIFLSAGWMPECWGLECGSPGVMGIKAQEKEEGSRLEGRSSAHPRRAGTEHQLLQLLPVGCRFPSLKLSPVVTPRCSARTRLVSAGKTTPWVTHTVQSPGGVYNWERWLKELVWQFWEYAGWIRLQMCVIGSL